MDPLSIATGCVSITVAVPTLMMRIMVFVAEVKGARKDLDGVHRGAQLITAHYSSLQLCLNALRIEDQTGRCKLPPDIVTQTCQILVNIEATMNQISDLLEKLGSGCLGRRIQWATTEKEEVAKLRSSLKSNKTALEISLTLGSITMLVEQNTKAQAHHDQTVELTRMTQQLTVQTAATDGKVELLLQRRDNSKNIENIQAALAELKEELVTLSASSGKLPVAERLTQLMKDHAVSLLDTESIRCSTQIVETVRDIQKLSKTDQDSGLLVPAGESGTCYGCSDNEEELHRLEDTLSKQERWFSEYLKISECEVERVILDGRNRCSSLEKRYDEDIRKIQEEAIHREKALKATADHFEKLYARSIAWMRTERTAFRLSSILEFLPWDRDIIRKWDQSLVELSTWRRKPKILPQRLNRLIR